MAKEFRNDPQIRHLFRKWRFFTENPVSTRLDLEFLRNLRKTPIIIWYRKGGNFFPKIERNFFRKFHKKENFRIGISLQDPKNARKFTHTAFAFQKYTANSQFSQNYLVYFGWNRRVFVCLVKLKFTALIEFRMKLLIQNCRFIFLNSAWNCRYKIAWWIPAYKFFESPSLESSLRSNRRNSNFQIRMELSI